MFQFSRFIRDHFSDCGKITLWFVVVLCGSILAAQEPVFVFDFSRGTTGWHQQKFRDSKDLVTTNTADGVQFSPREPGTMVTTFFTSLATPATSGDELAVTIRYRTKQCAVKPLIALSGGQGCNIPCSREQLALISDGAWHDGTVVLNYARHQQELRHIVLEILFEGNMAAGDQLEIAAIQIVPVAPDAVGFVTYPRSGNIVSGLGRPEPVSVAWQINTGNHHLAAALIDPETAALLQEKEITEKAGVPVEFDFDTAGYPDNQRFLLRLQVDGETVGELPFRKFTPSPDAFLMIDGVPYYHGKPFLIIGLYHVSTPVLERFVNPENVRMGVPPVRLDELMHAVAERGFNVVHNSWGAASKEYHQLAAQNNLLVVNEFPSEQQMEELKDQPNLLGWYPFDELKSGSVTAAAAAYRRIKELDPNHPVCSAFEQGGNGLSGAPLVDLAFEDFYRICGPDSDISERAKFYKLLEQDILKNDPATCLITVPQLFAAQVYAYFTEPTYEQLRAEVYQGLACGAKGVFYYSLFTPEPLNDAGMAFNRERKQWFLPESPLWEQIRQLNGELLDLQEIILTGRVTDQFTINGPQISCRAWRLGDSVYLFAVNGSGRNTTEATWSYPDGWQPVDRLYDTRPVPTARQWRLAPYEVVLLRFAPRG